MAFAAFLAIAVSIPAAAVNQPSFDWSSTQHIASVPGQTLTAAAGSAAAVGRDSYTVALPPPPDT
ncbi:hypothetical protein [Subtercola vilae]|uniref:Uncharacterized protein n=1 Tax=Subtercola vilae TaxID=2056433 RepID=A0A4T2C1L5_9MICO|nr:hypothetical protein [Subtercola vilae]TIH36186.1 hypothetical protein D4765_10465 [Subtercola vilae]